MRATTVTATVTATTTIDAGAANLRRRSWAVARGSESGFSGVQAFFVCFKSLCAFHRVDDANMIMMIFLLRIPVIFHPMPYASLPAFFKTGAPPVISLGCQSWTARSGCFVQTTLLISKLMLRDRQDFAGPDLASGCARERGNTGNSRPDARSGPTRRITSVITAS
jgi:hypothetical protein